MAGPRRKVLGVVGCTVGVLFIVGVLFGDSSNSAASWSVGTWWLDPADGASVDATGAPSDGLGQPRNVPSTAGPRAPTPFSPPQAEHSVTGSRLTNPHIVSLGSKEALRSLEPQRVLEKMRSECSRGLPMLERAPWANRRGIPTAYNNQTYLFQRGVVCYDDRTRWYYDGEQENTGGNPTAPRSLQEPFNRPAIEFKPTALLHSMHNNASFREAMARTLASDRFFFHRSLGILSVGHWGTCSIYHFLMDLLMGMVSLILSNPDLEALPRDTIQMHENHVVTIEKWNLPPCFECLSVAAIVTDNLHQPNITISSQGPVDGSMRCFCGLVLSHHQGLTSRAPCCSRPMTERSHVSDVMTWMKQRLIDKWQYRPFGDLVEYDDYAKYGFWPNATDPRKPRLLFLLRTKSRFIGRKEELMQAARDLGFSVHAMAFEAETMERQFAAGRYADVVVGTHGAALTSLIMMDTSGSRMLCRSLIEFFHWAPLGRIVHYQKMAYMVNVSALGIQPVDVIFGKSVANPRKERKALKSFSYTWSGTGFHDQTAFYNVNVFKTRLGEAIRNLKRCPADAGIDTSAMVLP